MEGAKILQGGNITISASAFPTAHWRHCRGFSGCEGSEGVVGGLVPPRHHLPAHHQLPPALCAARAPSDGPQAGGKQEVEAGEVHGEVSHSPGQAQHHQPLVGDLASIKMLTLLLYCVKHFI